MIEIIIYPFENSIKYEDECINVLEIENQRLFIAIVESFYELSVGGEPKEKINVFKNGEQVSFSKVAALIIDPFTIELDDRKIITKLYHSISENLYYDIEKVEEFSKISQKLITNVMRVANEVDFEYEYNIAPNIIDIMKMLSLKIAFKKNATLVEKFLEYINVISTFAIYELIVLINLKNYFTEEDLLEMYKYAKYRKIELLLIESKTSFILKYERKITIDNEYDEFLEKNK